jgi:Lar family restriction alleviation protein
MEAAAKSYIREGLEETKVILRRPLERRREGEGEENPEGVNGCPFCGCTRMKVKSKEREGLYKAKISCMACGAGLESGWRVDAEQAKAHAFAKWNVRRR